MKMLARKIMLLQPDRSCRPPESRVSSRPLFASALIGLIACMSCKAGHAQPRITPESIRAAGVVRVCIWPDYYGISIRNPKSGELTGIDIDLSRELARDLGVRIRHVDSSFATLVSDVRSGKCDVAMFAIGITEQRQALLAFTRPYLRSDIYAIAPKGSRLVRRWEDIDQRGVVVAVQAGTYMEPVMRSRLRQATLQVISAPLTREEEVRSGRADVFMTDYPYSRRLLDNADWATLISSPVPYFPLPYGYATQRDAVEWLARLDRFVADIKRDGRLRAAASKFGLSEIVVDE